MVDTILHRLIKIIGKEKAIEIYHKINDSKDRLGTDPEIVELMSNNPQISILLADRDQVISETKKLFNSGEFGVARSSTFKSLLRIRTVANQRRETLRYLRRFLSDDDINLILLAYNIVVYEQKCYSPYSSPQDQNQLKLFRERREKPKWRDRAHKIYNIVSSQYLDEVIIPKMMEEEQELVSQQATSTKIIDTIQKTFDSYLKYNENVVWVSSHNSDEWIESQIKDRMLKMPADGMKVYCRSHNWNRVGEICEGLQSQYPSLNIGRFPEKPPGAGGYYLLRK